MMSTLAILALVFGLVGTLGSIGLGIGQTVANKQSVVDTNATNLQAVRETNQSNVEQANLAYQRSLPVNQVKNLMDAGMSRPAALASLTGGGTYTAPVLQAAHADAPQMDFGIIQSAMERLGGIPSSVEQANILEEQRNALKVDTENKINADRRAQERHEFDMWQMRYGKQIASKRDAFNAKISNLASSQNISLDDIRSKDEFIRRFGLRTDPDWNSLPKLVQDEFYNDVMANSAEYRANNADSRAEREQSNRDIAAKDKHAIDQQTLDDLEAHAAEYRKDSKVRDKQRAAELVEADIRKIMADMGLTAAELKRDIDIETRPDGTKRVSPHKGIQGVAKTFWETIGAVAGIEYVGDILAKILTIK